MGEYLNGTKQNTVIPYVSEMFYIDGNRTDTYVPDGTQIRPFKSASAAMAAATGSHGYAFHIAPGTYTEANPVVFPNVPIVIYGNDATVTWSGGVTIQNPNYARYDLNSIGNVVFSSSSAGRIVVQGGSIAGNITMNGLTDFKSCGLTGGVITANATAQVLMIVCTVTSRIVGTGTIFIENCNLNRTDNTNPLVAPTGGLIVVVNSIVTNLGSAGAISCNNGATLSAPNIIANNVITVASGTPVACGTAVTIYSKNTINGVNTGTGFIPVTSDIIGPAAVAIGSDATGDMYFRNALGALTRLAVGAAGTVLIGGTTPSYLQGVGGNITIVTGLQFSGTTLQMKTQSVTVTGGVVTAIGAESGWSNVPTV